MCLFPVAFINLSHNGNWTTYTLYVEFDLYLWSIPRVTLHFIDIQ